MTDASDIEAAGSRLWNQGIGPREYGDDSALYQAAVLEQYKIYVEMADRISQRRAVANTFFVTLNTTIITAAGLLGVNLTEVSGWVLVFPLTAVLVQCFAWFYLLRSYRLLNSAKYAVIGELEERLPASPYWRAEWGALGQGRDRSQYWPLTHIEKWIPILFGITYVAGFAAVLTM